MESSERSRTGDQAILVRIRGVAHDLANLLVSIHGGVEIATQEQSTEQRLRWLHTARLACGRAVELVEQLTLLASGQELSREHIDPAETVRDLISLVLDCSATDVSYSFQRSPTRPILANRSQLGQVVLNLLINARDAVTERSISTRGTSGSEYKPHVAISLYEAEAPDDPADGGQVVILRIADNGGGIPDQLVGRVFDPLFTTKPASSGSGLGLATTRRIVTEHGGDVSVDSTLGTGTTFTAWFPIA